MAAEFQDYSSVNPFEEELRRAAYTGQPMPGIANTDQAQALYNIGHVQGGKEGDNQLYDYLQSVASNAGPRTPTPFVQPGTSVAGPWYFMGDTPIGTTAPASRNPTTGQMGGGFVGPKGQASPLMDTLVDYALKTGWTSPNAAPAGEPQGMAQVRGPINPQAGVNLSRLETALGSGQRVPISALQQAADYLGSNWVLKKKPRSTASSVGIGAGTALGAIAGAALGGPLGGAAGGALANAGVQAAAQRSEPGTFNPYEVGAAGVSGAVGGAGLGGVGGAAARVGTSALGNIAAQYGQNGTVNWPSVAAAAAGGAVPIGVNWLGNQWDVSPLLSAPAAGVAGGAVSGAISGKSRNPFLDAGTGLAGATPSLLYQGR